MKKILITGALGFIGRNCAIYFAKKGYEVVGGDCISGKIEGIEVKKVNLIEDDLEQWFAEEKPDAILHCAGAADVGASIKNPHNDFERNTCIVHKILFAMKKLDMEKCRFIYLSSAAVYGQPEKLPITEEGKLAPLSPYALHKKLGEDICQFFIENYYFDIKIVRIFSAFGPGLRKQIFWDMNYKLKETGGLDLWGTGNESRDYIYIDDIAQALYLITTVKKQEDYIYNLANGKEIFIKDVAKTFVENEGVGIEKIRFNGKIREGDPVNWRADITKLKKIGYKQTVDFAEGVKRYVEWCNNEAKLKSM